MKPRIQFSGLISFLPGAPQLSWSYVPSNLSHRETVSALTPSKPVGPPVYYYDYNLTRALYSNVLPALQSLLLSRLQAPIPHGLRLVGPASKRILGSHRDGAPVPGATGPARRLRFSHGRPWVPGPPRVCIQRRPLRGLLGHTCFPFYLFFLRPSFREPSVSYRLALFFCPQCLPSASRARPSASRALSFSFCAASCLPSFSLSVSTSTFFASAKPRRSASKRFPFAFIFSCACFSDLPCFASSRPV